METKQRFLTEHPKAILLARRVAGLLLSLVVLLSTAVCAADEGRARDSSSGDGVLGAIRTLSTFWLSLGEGSCGRFVFRVAGRQDGSAANSPGRALAKDRILSAVRARFDEPGLMSVSVMMLDDDGVVVDWVGDRQAALAALHDLGRGPVLEFRMADTSGNCMAAADALLVAMREEGTAGDLRRELDGGSVRIESDRQAELLAFVDRLGATGSVPEGRKWFLEERTVLDKPRFTAWCLGDAALTDVDVGSAEALRDDFGDWRVSLSFHQAGAERLAELTGSHVNGYLAIVVEGRVVSVPVIKEAITGGRAQISIGGYGPDSQSQAEQLARQLERGGFPVPLVLEQEQSPPAHISLLLWLARLPPLPEPILVVFDTLVRVCDRLQSTTRAVPSQP